MSAVPLRVTVISAEHIDHLPDVPVLSRTILQDQVPENLQYLDDLRLDSDFWTPAWGENLLARLQDVAIDNSVAYVVPGHPMLGDATMQFLLGEDSADRIDLELFDEPLPVILTEVLSLSGGSPAFVDALSLLEIDHKTPFNAGSLPLNSTQTNVITNVVPGYAGSDLQRILCRRFRADTRLRLIPMAGEPEQAEIRLDQLEHEATGYPCYLIVPRVERDEFQRSADDLQRLVARLRAPGGCPWDREQTNVSLGRNLVEESYELLDAIESGDQRAMREELGDFLLQAFLHTQITEEAGQFAFEDVIETLIEKLVRRHPHVFAQGDAVDSEGVVRTWDEIKRAERSARPGKQQASLLGDIPGSLPALMRAQSVIKRSSRTQLSVDEIEDVSNQAYAALTSEDERRIVAQILQAVQEAQELGVDVEHDVRAWTMGFEKALENRARPEVSPPTLDN